MSAARLCPVDKDLEKFIKFLALKSVQVVVQSRLGVKIQTQCDPQSGNGWVSKQHIKLQIPPMTFIVNLIEKPHLYFLNI